MNTPSNVRDGLMIAGLGAIVVAVWLWLGSASTIQLLVSAFSYALVALGLNLQWGYAGQFNFGIIPPFPRVKTRSEVVSIVL